MGSTDTIVAIATAPGAGGIGIVRLSGPAALRIAERICRRTLLPRQAHRVRFAEPDAAEAIDDGVVIAFPGPGSFTGEDVAELQAHGSPAVLQQLVALCCRLGARHARPGEFSERAFLNQRMDLAQAEAVADLIAASDVRAARAARRSLEGGFSASVEAISATLVHLRVHVEAAIDFADESIDTLGGAQLRQQLQMACQDLQDLLHQAERGRKLRDGLHAVIVGPPNAGKSSLLNALAGSDRAIVAPSAGTTRDTLRETVRIDGFELTLVDTAGLRAGGDAVEREGMRRAHLELQRADLALVVVDARAPTEAAADLREALAGVPMQLWVHNKSDLLDRVPADTVEEVYVSARGGRGLANLHARLGELAAGAPGAAGEGGSGEFSARVRHVEALGRALAHVDAGKRELDHERLDLAAEELHLAHDALGEITGKVSADDMLGRVFASFCIGK